MFLRFYKESSSKKALGKLVKKFANSVMSFEKNVSPAQIQEYFRFYRSDPDAAIKNVTLEDIICGLNNE
ncbi:Mitochondrial chaperone BCS1 [Temnothorax longispinosus]|uniref:Mitochondrial chaperone BCS1 n=1 Tax=Temnothorax longispinosus TaxID=300112 RepID=A0A4S2KVP6_9HYME|nr:Mitochondrial chaperone BCS1 [Temnothorax longispinosus]